MTGFVLDTDAWFAGTAELTLEEEAAYLRVCCLMYDRRGPIPDNPQVIASKLRVPVRRWNKLRTALMDKEKLYLTEHGWLANGRAMRQLEMESEAKAARSAEMAELAKKRWENERNSGEKPEKIGKKSPERAAQVIDFARADECDRIQRASARVEDILTTTSDSFVDVDDAPAREDRKIVRWFKERRDEHWPESSRLPAPDVTLEAQAQQFLNGGAPLALINDVIERCMASEHARGAPPPTSLKFCHLTMGRAISNHLATVETGHAERTHDKPRSRSLSVHGSLIAAGLEAANRRGD